MSRRVLFVAAFACALLACKKDAPVPAAPKAEPIAALRPTPDADVDNSLNLMYGAALVSRGGELDLSTSAVHTMDGFHETTWTCVPGMPEETLVYSMLAPTRIERIGVTTGDGDDVPDAVAFDTSMDGKAWTELATMKPARTEERQLMGVKPVVAQYLRVRTLDPKKYYVRIRGVHAMGEEVAPPRTPSFGGCWTINGVRADLEQRGARITGTIAMDPPLHLDGGTDNRVGLVMWMQGPMWGYAAITRSPDGKHLSGLSFFEEPDSKYSGEGWFGERCEARATPNVPPPQDFLARARHYSLFGLVFDPNERLIEEVSMPTLDAVASLIAASPQTRFRIVARELRYDTPQQNRQRTAARLQALRAALQRRGVDVARIDFIAAGGDYDGPALRSGLQRVLASRIDLLSEP